MLGIIFSSTRTVQLFIGSTLWGPISGSNRTICHLNCGQTNDMLNWISWKITILSFNGVQTNNWCLTELLVLNVNTWKHLTVCKQIIISKRNCSYWIEISETIQLCANKQNKTKNKQKTNKQTNKTTTTTTCPVGWGCRIHRLLLCRGVRPLPPTSVLDMTINNQIVRLQQCWSFGECGVPLHCHCSQVHSGPEW